MRLHSLLLFFFSTLLAAAPATSLPGSASDAGSLIFSGELTREFTLLPGASAEGRLVIHNASAEPCTARLYQTDYNVQADEAAYGEAGQSKRSNAGWIELGERQPELQPGETREIPFKITAPTDSALRGTYWSMIMIEPLATDAVGPRGGVSIRAVVRYGVQIVAQLGESPAPRPEISHQAIASEGGKRVLRFDISNHGERWLRPKLEVRLFDQEGRAVTTLPASSARIYPGASSRQRFDLTNLARGEYLALIVLDTEDELYGVQYRFHLED